MASSDDARHINWSLGEIASLATKAARGAGMPWGLADETGFAVSWLQARGIPGLAALCRYLNWRDSSAKTKLLFSMNGDNCHCPIAIGTAYLDGALSATITIKTIREPLLILPFIAMRNGTQPVQVSIGDLSLQVSENGVVNRYLDQTLLLSEAQCTISTATNSPFIPAPAETQRVPSYFYGCVIALQKFAERTYAPATEESRLAGAGAGLSDND